MDCRENKFWVLKYALAALMLFFLPLSLVSQPVTDTLPSKVTLSQCISYALANHSLIKQSMIDEDIMKKNIRISLSGWYPQVELDADFQHYFKIPYVYYPDPANPAGPPIQLPAVTSNVSSGILAANQIIYSSSLLYAARSSKELRNEASENTESSRINIYVNVSKAFFDVLLTEAQLRVLDEDIMRLQRNYKDAYSLYQSGVTDNIDFQRASMSLSNIKAQRKTTEQAMKAKYAVLKQFMGVDPGKNMTVMYDTTRLESEILIDTTLIPVYSNRVEYRLMQSALKLQTSEISYNKTSFLPTLSAFYNYDPSYGNDQFSELYSKNNPSSLVGLRLTFPLFQGLSRIESLSRSRLQYNRISLGMDYLKSEISSEYTTTLAAYIGNLNELDVAKKNISIAKNIFNTVKFQYDKGVKAYLEVIVSETDLRTAELNYLDILFQVLSSKIDLEKALGIIPVK
ncbi:MAG: TolC family protein [Bacteroidales bacterium]